MGWDGLSDLLSEVPDDQWCDCYVVARMDSARAIELGVGLAHEVANVFDALLPLYAASVKR